MQAQEMRETQDREFQHLLTNYKIIIESNINNSKKEYKNKLDHIDWWNKFTKK